ncbi:hypothetical protein H6P81_014010 [Aristolochia fimbriata]|uniref:Uncharacterized protein n=1 Tax=Aristolochia fimbriata TaxID=158543 RepID=A0AAV7EJY9_ARIFI|nr:hypothetical protein H6P81_014010 [Aristolochia fimbriata]
MAAVPPLPPLVDANMKLHGCNQKINSLPGGEDFHQFGQGAEAKLIGLFEELPQSGGVCVHGAVDFVQGVGGASVCAGNTHQGLLHHVFLKGRHPIGQFLLLFHGPPVELVHHVELLRGELRQVPPPQPVQILLQLVLELGAGEGVGEPDAEGGPAAGKPHEGVLVGGAPNGAKQGRRVLLAQPEPLGGVVLVLFHAFIDHVAEFVRVAAVAGEGMGELLQISPLLRHPVLVATSPLGFHLDRGVWFDFGEYKQKKQMGLEFGVGAGNLRGGRRGGRGCGLLHSPGWTGKFRNHGVPALRFERLNSISSPASASPFPRVDISVAIHCSGFFLSQVESKADIFRAREDKDIRGRHILIRNNPKRKEFTGVIPPPIPVVHADALEGRTAPPPSRGRLGIGIGTSLQGDADFLAFRCLGTGPHFRHIFDSHAPQPFALKYLKGANFAVHSSDSLSADGGTGGRDTGEGRHRGRRHRGRRSPRMVRAISPSQPARLGTARAIPHGRAPHTRKAPHHRRGHSVG